MLISRVTQRIKKKSVDNTSVKNVLIQSWRYKTLAVLKRHKSHLLIFIYEQEQENVDFYSALGITYVTFCFTASVVTLCVVYGVCQIV